MGGPSITWIASKILSYFQPETPRDHEKALRCARVIVTNIEQERDANAKMIDAAWNALFAVHLTQGISGLPLDRAIAQELDGMLVQIRALQGDLDEAQRKLRAFEEAPAT